MVSLFSINTVIDFSQILIKVVLKGSFDTGLKYKKNSSVNEITLGVNGP